MRVLDVTSFFSDSCGGIKSYYRHKARFLPALGVECHFVVPGARAEVEAFGGGLLHRIPGPRLPGHGAYRIFGHWGALGRLIRDLDPDVIEIGSHLVLPGLVRRALRSHGDGRRPMVVGFFHSDLPRTLVEPVARRLPAFLGAPLLKAAWAAVRRVHARYDATLVASREIETVLRAQGVPRVSWVGLGVDTDLFHPGAAGPPQPGAPPTVIYAGRLSGDKGFSLVLEAFDAIHRATGARLRIVGDGPGRRQARRFVAARPGAVSFDGYLDAPAAVAAALAAADVALTPGAHETFSLATAEAMACGTPVVAAGGGGARELVAASGAGLTFPAGDAEALAAAVVALLSRPPWARRALGARGRAHVLRALTWRAVMGRIHAVYAQLVASADEGAAAA